MHPMSWKWGYSLSFVCTLSLMLFFLGIGGRRLTGYCLLAVLYFGCHRGCKRL
ncbi:uncharacterized protein BDW70DRAFT_132528, partial [Aspergillus foveolatus]|uniref:uncharacterized protein n=1 Tax=Aspergillus foveolatus TaxID=210207 RepID=UPI003CCDE7C3